MENSYEYFLIDFFYHFSQNTMRLWLPQLFASINEYEQISSETTSMCTILEYSVNKTEIVKNPGDECIVVSTQKKITRCVF